MFPAPMKTTLKFSEPPIWDILHRRYQYHGEIKVNGWAHIASYDEPVYSSMDCLELNLSIRMSLEGSMDDLRDAGPEGLRDDKRRSDGLREAAAECIAVTKA